jgi:hypothetical protein
MKSIEWLAIIPTVNNGWAFSAFVVLVLAYLYSIRKDPK